MMAELLYGGRLGKPSVTSCVLADYESVPL
jgi:hypothetical protein